MVGQTAADRLREARIKAGYKTATAFAEAHDLPTTTYANHEGGRRGIKDHAARQYARLLKVSPEWLTYGIEGGEVDQAEDLPIYASAAGGDGQVLLFDSEPVDFSTRPACLADAPDGYGVIIVGDSMEPAYRSGDTLYINPHLPVEPGMDVLVVRTDRKAGNKLASVKQLMLRTAKELHLRQYNPPAGQARDFSLNSDEVEEVVAVVGLERHY